MQAFFTDYLSNLQEFHDEIRVAIKGLPPSALDWTADAEINSITVLTVHLIGAERYWIGDVICGEDSGRDRASEFKVQGLTEQDLFQKLEEIESYLRKALESLTLQDLEQKRISPRNAREVSVGWALGHALKHSSLHLGHIQITRQLWEQQQFD